MAKNEAKPRRTDWEAVERDYRTGKFTQRELADKYGVSHGAIGKHARSKGWTQDLAHQIRQATNAKLVAELVSSEVAKSSQEVSKTVLAAAEVNKQIVLGHRSRLSDLAGDCKTARDKLLALIDTVADVREAATAVSAIESLARTTKTLIDKEREAFGLNDKSAEEEPQAAALNEVDRANRLAAILSAAQARAKAAP